MGANLLGMFGVISVLLASAAVYVVLASTVSARQREFRIRLALGAQRATLLRHLGRTAVGLLVPGVVVGNVLAVVGLSYLGSLVDDISIEVVPYCVAASGIVLCLATCMSLGPVIKVSRLSATRVM
jgi:ABC-type antimicrobial peptide transport system permease subunit